jgi:hypothetical protein
VPTARLRITSTNPKTKIGVVQNQNIGVSTGGGYAQVYQIDEVCEAPCDLTVRPGSYPLVAQTLGRNDAELVLDVKVGEDIAYEVHQAREFRDPILLVVLSAAAITGLSGMVFTVDPLDKSSQRGGIAAIAISGAITGTTLGIAIPTRTRWKPVPPPAEAPAPAAPAPAP